MKKYIILLILLIGSFLLAFFLLNRDSLESTESNLTESNVEIEEVITSDKEILPVEIIEEEITIHIAGDSMLAEHVGGYIIDLEMNPFQFFIEEFNNDDLTVINLETNISTPGVGVRRNKNYTFNAPLESLDRMVDADIDLVSLANNHTMDFGETGIVDMFNHLNENNIQYFGAGNSLDEAFTPLITDIKGTKIAWIGINEIEGGSQDAGINKPGSATFDKTRIITAINYAEENADLTVIFPHWGTEHDTEQDQYQIDLAHMFIDSGADLVIGAHPHVRQGSEIYKDKHIYYSLGNFVFTGMGWNPEAVIGTLLEIKIENKEIIEIIEHTVDISYHGVPNIQGEPWE